MKHNLTTIEIIDDFYICPNCQSKLIVKTHNEKRPYQEGYVNEQMSELVCENCNWKDE